MTYHHGNLREALVDAAVQLLVTEGEGGLSLRKVAIHAGVSHAAPYHHFADKEALLAAVCETGYLRLTAAMVAVSAPDPFDRLRGLGAAYVQFARQQPDLFRFMFGTHVPDKTHHPELMLCAEGSFGVLVEAIIACVATGRTRPGDPVELAIHVWAMTHGIASLVTDSANNGNKLSRMSHGLPEAMLLEHYFDVVAQSLFATPT